MQSSEGVVKFSVDSSLLFQLGERLVAKASVAMAELVKNAYDADATQVSIILENVSEVGGTIIISDNGHGMLLDEIISGWMRIATTQKQINHTSRRYCRTMSGAKGIGRFAARRLGSILEIQSVAKRDDGQKEIVYLKFDWNSFIPGSNLDQFGFDYKQTVVNSEEKTGLTLLISDVRDVWREVDLEELRKDLFELQTPFPDLIEQSASHSTSDCEADTGFNITIEVADQQRNEEATVESLGDEFLKHAWGKLEGTVSSDGYAQYTLKYLAGSSDDEETLVDTESPDKYTDLVDAKFRIYFFIYERKYFDDFYLGLQAAQRKGRDEGGVRIYVDGFRVASFGSKGNDWLGLDAARGVYGRSFVTQIGASETFTQLGPNRAEERLPRNRDVFGAVMLSSGRHGGGEEGNTGIQIAMSRETLVATPTYERLRRFVQRGIYWLTLKYEAKRIASKAIKPEIETEVPVPDKLEQIADELADTRAKLLDTSMGTPPQVHPSMPKEDLIRAYDETLRQQELEKAKLSQVLEQVESEVRASQEQAQKDKKEQITEQSMLRLLATAGTTVMVVQHQIGSLSSEVETIQRKLQELEPYVDFTERTAFSDVRGRVSGWYDMFKKQIQPLELLLSRTSRERKRRLNLYESVDKTISLFSYYTAKYGIEFRNNIPRTWRTPPIFEAELNAILLNIITNALKAVRDHVGEKIIAIEANKTEEYLVFQMMNTGKRLAKDRWERVFLPFESDSIADPTLGVGTGLGLKIVKDVVLQYRGRIHFVEPLEGFSTSIEISLAIDTMDNTDEL